MGTVSIPALLIIICSLLMGIGFWSLLRLERHAEGLQLKLLSCVGLQAIRFKELQNDIEKTNRRIDQLRAALAASLTHPEAISLLKEGLSALSLQEDFMLTQYRVKASSWTLVYPCRSLFFRLSATSAPEPDWTRPPPDILGPQALVRTQRFPDSFQFFVRAQQGSILRSAFALVRFDPTRSEWIAEWGHPPLGVH